MITAAALREAYAAAAWAHTDDARCALQIVRALWRLHEDCRWLEITQ